MSEVLERRVRHSDLFLHSFWQPESLNGGVGSGREGHCFAHNIACQVRLGVRNRVVNSPTPNGIPSEVYEQVCTPAAFAVRQTIGTRDVRL